MSAFEKRSPAGDQPQRETIPDSWWYHAPRLALQPVLAWWALFCVGAVDWPWRKVVS
jgi:hypothetical protein